MASFKISARTILQLGAELISSDEIAFYELVKNAIDAHSPRVEIDIISRLSHADYISLKEDIENRKIKIYKDLKAVLEKLKLSIKEKLIIGSPDLDIYLEDIDSAKSFKALRKTLDKANYIKIQDFGDGMSLNDLEDIYLTIGTRNRYLEKQVSNKNQYDEHPVLGEKGIGRLSVMRLGNYLSVKTSMEGEESWNILEIDWDWFSHESDKLLGEIQIKPTIGEAKEDSEDSGTTICIFALNSDWTLNRVNSLANESFNRFTDPFNPDNNYPIDVYFNNVPIPIPGFDSSIFKFAHATVEANFKVNKDQETQEVKSLRLSGKVNYRLRKTEKSFDLDTTELASLIKPIPMSLLIVHILNFLMN